MIYKCHKEIKASFQYDNEVFYYGWESFMIEIFENDEVIK